MNFVTNRKLDSILSVEYSDDKSRFEMHPVVEGTTEEDCVLSNQSNYRILLLDDNTVFLRAIARLLETYSIDVVTEECHLRAYDKVAKERHHFDLALVDVGLRECSGFQFAEKIEHLHNAPPVMLMSGEHQDRGKPTPPNVKGFLSKPFSVSDLIRIIQDVKFDSALSCC